MHLAVTYVSAMVLTANTVRVQLPPMPPLQGYGLGRREGNSSDSSGSGPVTPGEGGVGPVKYKAAGESGGAGRVSVPPRATTSDEVRQPVSAYQRGALGYLLLPMTRRLSDSALHLRTALS